MKRLSHLLSPWSAVILVAGLVFLSAVVRSSPWQSFVALLAIELVCFAFLWMVEKPLFSILGLGDHPDSRGPKDAQSLGLFPLRRALFQFLIGMSFPLIPIFLVFQTWPLPNENSMLTAYLVHFVALIFFVCVSLIETHVYLAKNFFVHNSKLSADSDAGVIEGAASRKVAEFEMAIPLSLIFFWPLMNWWIVSAVEGAQYLSNATRFVLANTVFVAFAVRLFFVLYSYVAQTIAWSNSLEKDTSHRFLPFGILSLFWLYPLRLKGFRDSNQEKSEAPEESSNLQHPALDQALRRAVHDLSTPLHVVNFCVEQLKADPSKISDSTYIDRLERSSQRSIRGLDRLRTITGNSGEALERPEFRVVFQRVRSLLKLDSENPSFSTVKFVVDPKLEELKLKVPDEELEKIMYLLLRRSLDGVLTDGAEGYRIELGLASSEYGNAVIRFRVRGKQPQAPGLGAQEGMTPSISSFYAEGGSDKLSQLIRRNSGHLRFLSELEDTHSGPVFELELPVVERWLVRSTRKGEVNEFEQVHLDH